MGPGLEPTGLPGWKDCVSVAERPWYTASAPRGKEWFSQLRHSIDEGRLSPRRLRSLVKEGCIRPSVLYQIEHGIENPFLLPKKALDLDRAFVAPEMAVEPERLRALKRMDPSGWANPLFSLYLRLPESVREAKVRRLAVGALRRLGGFVPRAPSIGKPAAAPAYDLVFMIKRKTADRDVERVCSRIGRHVKGRWCVSAGTMGPPPLSRAYYFHDAFFFWHCVNNYPHIRRSAIAVFWDAIEPKELLKKPRLIELLNAHARAVFCRNSKELASLVERGLDREKAHLLLGGADPVAFKGHARTGGGAVGFCASYRPRRLPGKILELVRSMPHRKFLLVSPRRPENDKFQDRWERYERFNELKALPNLSYIEAPPTDFPRYYAGMDVFVSVSALEGGPLSLLEAMMSNVVPVASRTGFAPDLVRHGENGFLFDADADLAEIRSLIDKAFAFEADVRRTVERFAWRNVSEKIQSVLASGTSTGIQ